MRKSCERESWHSLDATILAFSLTKPTESRRRQVISALQLGSLKAQTVMVKSVKLTKRDDSERLDILQRYLRSGKSGVPKVPCPI